MYESVEEKQNKYVGIYGLPTGAHRLEGANTLDRIEAAAEELDHRAVPQQVRTERGRSTWKGGDVMEQSQDTYYTVMTNVSK